MEQGDDIGERKSGAKKGLYVDVHESTITSGPQELYNHAESIYSCALDEPPPRLTTDVKLACNIRATVDVTSLPKRVGKDGTPYREVQYAREVEVSGSILEFSIKFQGNLVGQQSVEADLEDEDTSEGYQEGLQ